MPDFILSEINYKDENKMFILYYSLLKLFDAYLWSITIPLSFAISSPARRKAIINLFRMRWEIHVSWESYYEMIFCLEEQDKFHHNHSFKSRLWGGQQWVEFRRRNKILKYNSIILLSFVIIFHPQINLSISNVSRWMFNVH